MLAHKMESNLNNCLLKNKIIYIQSVCLHCIDSIAISQGGV